MELIKPSRRGFLGLLGVGLAAPMIVKVASIMPVRAQPALWVPAIVNPVPVLPKELRTAWWLESNSGKIVPFNPGIDHLMNDANGIWHVVGSDGS